MGSDTPPTSLDLDRFLPYLLNVAASRLSTALGAVYQERFGLSIPEWRVMAHLARHRDVSVREIYARVDMDKVKVSRAAARLETAGLITKTVPPADKRLVTLTLTRKGLALYKQIAPLALDYEKTILAIFQPSEEALFRDLLQRLIGQLPPSRK